MHSLTSTIFYYIWRLYFEKNTKGAVGKTRKHEDTFSENSVTEKRKKDPLGFFNYKILHTFDWLIDQTGLWEFAADTKAAASPLPCQFIDTIINRGW